MLPEAKKTIGGSFPRAHPKDVSAEAKGMEPNTKLDDEAVEAISPIGKTDP